MIQLYDEYLTGKKYYLLIKKKKKVEQAKFTYSPLGKAFKEQTVIIK